MALIAVVADAVAVAAGVAFEMAGTVRIAAGHIDRPIGSDFGSGTALTGY